MLYKDIVYLKYCYWPYFTKLLIVKNKKCKIFKISVIDSMSFKCILKSLLEIFSKTKLLLEIYQIVNLTYFGRIYQLQYQNLSYCFR